jgi:hypothetical protein
MKTRTRALICAGLGLLLVMFAVSPWGRKYGKAVEFYTGLVGLALMAILTFAVLRDWWRGQNEFAHVENRRKDALSRCIEWWQHLQTDWDWKGNDKP